MTSFGYFLSSEEFGPRELVRQARLAEQAGFERLWISDHFHPWLGGREQLVDDLADLPNLPRSCSCTVSSCPCSAGSAVW